MESTPIRKNNADYWKAKYLSMKDERDRRLTQKETADRERNQAIEERDVDRVKLAKLDETALRAEVVAMQAKLDDRDHQDVFKKIQADETVGLKQNITIQKLWSLLGYKPEGKPDEKKARELVEAAKAENDFLFIDPEVDQPPARGKPDSHDSAPVIRAEKPPGGKSVGTSQAKSPPTDIESIVNADADQLGIGTNGRM